MARRYKYYGSNSKSGKTIETAGGQIIEVFGNKKEAWWWIESYDFENMPEDDTIFIEYKDGKYFTAGFNGEVKGKYKRSDIKTVIISNACTVQVYGEYRIYNMDDVDEEYSEAIDDEYKMWNVEEG